MALFDGDRFVADCVAAAAGDEPLAAVRELVERAVSDPGALQRRFPVPVDPDDDGILHRSAGLFVTCAVFPRGFVTGIHDHGVPAVIGGYAGRELNHLFESTASGLRRVATREVGSGDVLVLDTDAIHDVHVAGGSPSGALHVYLGDILARPRREWHDEAAPPSPFDGADLERRWTAAAEATGLLARE